MKHYQKRKENQIPQKKIISQHHKDEPMWQIFTFLGDLSPLKYWNIFLLDEIKQNVSIRWKRYIEL